MVLQWFDGRALPCSLSKYHCSLYLNLMAHISRSSTMRQSD